MEVKQIYELINDTTKEVLGKTEIVKEDLTGVVELGEEVLNANALDNYVKTLVNHIGKVIFVNRAYKGSAPSVLMDGWEFGSILEKVSADMPEATENESWKLEGNTSYDPNIFYQPKVNAKFFNGKVTFEVPMSFTEKQVKESFSSREQLNGFISMLYNAVDKAMTVKLDSLIMRTINNMIAETVAHDIPSANYSENTGVRAVNLLKLYNDRFNPDVPLTPDSAMITPEFIRFASLMMKTYVKRLSKISTLFNVGGKERFTPTDLLHVVMLEDFRSSAEVYLYGGQGQFKDSEIRLPDAETVPYWQGSGTDYGFGSISEINVKTSGGTDVELSGILGVMFDRDALGVSNPDRRTTSNYNPKAEFYSTWAKYDAEYFNDLNENFVVFFVA